MMFCPAIERRPARARGGYVSSSLLVFVVPTLALALGLMLEVALVGSAKERMQTAADAAALAAASDLLDPNVVKPGATPDPTTTLTTANKDAGLYANLNLMLGTPLVYPSPRPVFVVFGNVADPTTYLSGFGPSDAQHPANTVVVTIERSRRLKNPVPLRLGPLLGVIPGNVAVTSRGTLDQRVRGFRPIGEVPVPMVPLAVLASGSPASWTVQAQAAVVPHVNDKYTVDPHTGAVSNNPDGIPEVVVSAPLQGGPAAGPADNLAVLDLGSLNPNSTLIVRGLRPLDLTTLGGQIAFDSSGAVPLSGSPAADAGLTGPLQLIQGANRIWPLYGSSTGTTYRITQFVAGRIASVTTVAPGRLVLTVQPSVYPTATALVQAGQPLNPFIGKLGLTR